VAEQTLSPSLVDRHHFLLRRLHSLTGIVPVGVFLINHLLTNATAWLGAGKFHEHVAWINEMPFVLAIELFGIWLPLAFHGGYGVYIALQGKGNAHQYPYMDNWRYSLQRVTAWITLVFIIIHLLHFRFAYLLGQPEYKDAADFYLFTAERFHDLWLPLWLWLVIYVVGTAAAVFHFCNGIVTFCISWGITVNDSSRRYVGYAAAVLGVVLMVWGMLSLWAFATDPVPEGYLPGGHGAPVAPETVARPVPPTIFNV
jgi:succinate dehydrogenase / fumarate reductase cytochrome b subunit